MRHNRASKGPASNLSGRLPRIFLGLLIGSYVYMAAPARAQSCARTVDTLPAAQSYSECLEGELETLRRFVDERAQKLISENEALRRDLAEKIVVKQLEVTGNVSVAGDIRQGNVTLSNYYVIGAGDAGGDKSFVVWKPTDTPQVGHELFALISYFCSPRPDGGVPKPSMGSVGIDLYGTNKYVVSPPEAAYLVSWNNGQLTLHPPAYTECLMSVMR